MTSAHSLQFLCQQCWYFPQLLRRKSVGNAVNKNNNNKNCELVSRSSLANSHLALIDLQQQHRPFTRLLIPLSSVDDFVRVESTARAPTHALRRNIDLPPTPVAFENSFECSYSVRYVLDTKLMCVNVYESECTVASAGEANKEGLVRY